MNPEVLYRHWELPSAIQPAEFDLADRDRQRALDFVLSLHGEEFNFLQAKRQSLVFKLLDVEARLRAIDAEITRQRANRTLSQTRHTVIFVIAPQAKRELTRLEPIRNRLAQTQASLSKQLEQIELLLEPIEDALRRITWLFTKQISHEHLYASSYRPRRHKRRLPDSDNPR